MDWLSLLLPLGYLAILVLSLGSFSYIYRRRKAAAAASLEPWLPPNLQRQVYLSLLELASNPDRGQKIPDSVLRAALLRRATEDIHRVVKLRNQKPALTQLLQRGQVGDELMQRFQLAEKEMDDELKQVMAEANALAPNQNWGQTIFQSAGECAHSEVLRAKLADIEAGRELEVKDWEEKRSTVRDGFMKELEGSETVNGAAPAKEQRKVGSSDEDAVVVEANGPTSTPGGTESSPGGGKKKKNKK